MRQASPRAAPRARCSAGPYEELRGTLPRSQATSRNFPVFRTLALPNVSFMATAQQAQDTDPLAAAEALKTALSQAGIVLPSLAVDAGSPALGLVELGRVCADVAMRLADALRQGCEK